MTAPKLASYYSEKQDDGRYYKNPFTGDTASSVTTILKQEAKDNLIQWSADRVAQFFAENPDFALTRTKEQAFQQTRFKANEFRDERAEIGTAVHEWVEADLNGGWDYPELWDDEVRQCAEQWRLFTTEHKVSPTMVEVTVWNEEEEYAGTLDLFTYVDGVLWLLDVKTSKNLWDGHEYQLAALERAEYALVETTEDDPEASEKFPVTDWVTKKKVPSWWKKVALPKPEKRGFIHIRPEYTDPMTGVVTPAYWDLVEVPEGDIDSLFETFVAYNSVVKAKSKTAALRKSREPAKVTW